MTKASERIKQEIEREFGVNISVEAKTAPADYQRLTREMWEIEQEFGGPIAWERMVQNRMESDRRIVARWFASCAFGVASLMAMLFLASAGLDDPLDHAAFVLAWWVNTKVDWDDDNKAIRRIIQRKTGWGV